MKGPEAFNYSPEEEPVESESDREQVEGSVGAEELEESPEFDEGRIDRERLRGAIDSALDSGESNSGQPTTIEELRARVAELADKFEDETEDNSIKPEDLREVYRKISESLGEREESFLGPKETTEAELRERTEKIAEQERPEDWRDAA